MRFVLVATLFFCASTYAVPQPRGGLAEDLAEFQKLIPISSIKSVAIRYFIFDSEFRSFLNYLKGAETKAVWIQVTAHEEVQAFVAYLESQGVDVVKQLNKLADLLGFPHFPSAKLREGGALGPRSVKKFVEEVMGLIPVDKIEKLFEEKLQTSPAFKELFDKVAAFDFQEIKKFIENSPECTAVLNKVRGYGIDVDAMLEKLKDMFGWE